MNLLNLGWNDIFSRDFEILNKDNYRPARVSRVNKGEYVLIHEDGECTSKVSGKMKYNAKVPADYPSVGDWVSIKLINEDKNAIIYNILPRQTSFKRKAPISGGRKVKDVLDREMTFGGRTEEQVIASNIQTVFIVVAADKTFNVRRLERYLLVAWDSGAKPVIILNKIDKCQDVKSILTDIESVAYGLDIHMISALNNQGIAALKAYIKSGVTVGLFGASGVGKSTIINCLTDSRLLTGHIRTLDDKGRHTTTWREMVCLDTGGVLIDTPGMRELQVWSDKEALDDMFDDITSLESKCKFNDCSHNTEPGCAIKAALASGDLDKNRYENYKIMSIEVDYLDHRKNQKNIMHKNMMYHKNKQKNGA